MQQGIGEEDANLHIESALRQALAHHQAGRLQEAEQLYRAVLHTQPYHPDANHYLGVLAAQVGQHAAGLPFLKTALAVNPSRGQYSLSYAEALLATGQAKEALNIVQTAMQRGLNTPAAQALRQEAEAAALNSTAKGEAPTRADMSQLIALFNAGRYVELESRARLLVERYPHSGIAWNALVTSLQIQGKDALPALKQTTELLPDDADSHNNLGNALQDLGQFDDAVASYRRALNIKPEYAEVHYNLGIALQALGQLDDAVASYRRALEIKPDYADAYSNLSVALNALGHLDDALANCRRALEITPDSAEAHSNLGNALKALGRLDDAMRSYRRALEIQPDYALAHYNLGNAFEQSGQLDGAVASYRRALEINPDFVDAHNNLGTALKDLGQFDDAVASCRRALEIEPDFVEAHNNLGNSLKDLGQLNEATASYRRALEIKPDYAEAHNNLGNALKDLDQLNEAIASYRRALEIKPDYAEAHNNLGIALKDRGQFDDAKASFRRALEIKPDYADAHNNLGHALGYLGQLDAAVASFRRALEIKPDYADAHSNLLFIHNYLSDQPAETLLADARCFGDLVARQARPYTDWSNVAESGKSLRVGLVSGDLRNHPVGYFVAGVLEVLAANAGDRLEFIAYPSHIRTDTLSERIKTCCHGWHSAVGFSDERLARRIRDDGIDILIDLSGHTAHNRLPVFAWKPAPVQATWLGYFATTGVTAIDYLIADPWTLPETEEANFNETIWRLPETRLCFTPPDVDVQVAPLPALSNGYITFGCFNNLMKMNDAVVALWSQVLQTMPQSRLFLKTKQLGEATVRQSVISRFAAQGIGADRLILEGFAPRSAYLSAYHRVDIALDPFPFPGGTISAESLWMGVPVLTLSGERFLSRQGVGMLMNVGLPEWIAADADAYVGAAASHAGDLPRLAALRNGLRQRALASPLFDAARFARHLEGALRGMWQKWCNGRTKI